jgi:hypothetical protein
MPDNYGGVDLQGLMETMKNVHAHLQDAIQKNDPVKADQMHQWLGRLNSVAEEQTQKMQAQTTKIPGSDNGGPTGLIPYVNGKPVYMPNQPSNGPQLPPGFSEAAMAYQGMSPGGNKYSAMPSVKPQSPGDAAIEGMWNSYPGKAAEAVGQDILTFMRLPGELIKQGWENGGRQGTEEFFGLPKDSLTEAGLSKAFGSPEAAPKGFTSPPAGLNGVPGPQTPNQGPVAVKSNPGAFGGAPRELGTSEAEHTLPGNNPATKTQTGAYSNGELSKANDIMDRMLKGATQSGDTEEAQRISRYRQILEKKPSLFTVENLLSFLFAGAPRTFQKYGHEVSDWKGFMAKESELYTHYHDLQKARQQGTQAQQMHNNLEMLKMQYGELDKQGKDEAAPIEAAIQQAEKEMSNYSGSAAMLDPKRAENMARLEAEVKANIQKLATVHQKNAQRRASLFPAQPVAVNMPR